MHIAKKDLYRVQAIKNEWEKFIENKPVNLQIVSDDIYNSWKRSKEFGVNPFLELPAHSSGLASKTWSLATYVNDYCSEIKQILQQYVFDVFIYNNGGYLVYNFFKVVNSEICAKEDSIGTNAVALSLIDRKPKTVLGFEHYLQMAHSYYCYAAPFFDERGAAAGVVEIIFEDTDNLQQVALISKMFLAQICSMLGLLAVYHSQIDFTNREIHKILSCIPQGIAYLDYNNILKYYNEKILEILNISGERKEQELKKRLDSFNKGRKSVQMADKLGQKAVHVTVNEITDNSSIHRNRLIIVDDSVLKFKQKSNTNKAIHTFDSIIGENKQIVHAKQIAMTISQTSAPVLLIGETGTGKELFAQAIHNASLRKDYPFVAVNCGAIPAELIESELFGYEPGAFTGALKEGKKGLLEVASGGTLFLDEIESMPLHLQIKLLRTLSTYRIQKVGATEEEPIDIRIISASKKDLLLEADNGRFREDLYYRISTVNIKLPALRERLDDMPELVGYFIEKTTSEFGMSNIKAGEDYLYALPYYFWRGNIRELENVIRSSILLLEQGKKELQFNDLPERIQKAFTYNYSKASLSAIDIPKKDSIGILAEAENILIKDTLAYFNNNISKASRVLGIDRKTLYNKLNKQETLGNYLLCKKRIITNPPSL